jgi:hypothetical protein
MKRLLLMMIVFAVSFAVCLVLVTQIAGFLFLQANSDDMFLCSLGISLPLSIGLTWRRPRLRRKKKPCTAVNCFSLHFRA